MSKQYDLEHYLRQLRRIEEHREAGCEENVRKIYNELLKDLQGFLGKTYSELAVDDKLTYEILHSKGKYARFLEEVEQRINTHTPEAAREIRETVQATYKTSYEGLTDAVMQSKNYKELKTNLKGLRAVTPDVMKRAVENPISGLTLNDTLEKNRRAVIYDIKQQIGIGLSQGDRMSTMARRIAEKVGMDYRKAIRIVRTETHRVREAGYQDASERISQSLRDNDSDWVMTKTWKTMLDEAVRPQRRRQTKKGGWVRTIGNGPNHMKMHGKIVLVDELFDLGDGNFAKAPGQSGVAGHDINCRCYLSRDLMTKAEFAKLTGRQFEQTEIEKIAQQEQKLRDEQEQLLSDKAAYEAERKRLADKEFRFDYTTYDTGDYFYDEDTFDELQTKYRKWFDVTDKDEIDKLLASIDTDDPTEAAKILGSYFETELGFYKARDYALNAKYLLKYEAKDLDNLRQHVSRWTTRLHDEIQPDLKGIDSLIESAERYRSLKLSVIQINEDLESISDELSALRIKKYEAKGITLDSLFSDVQTRTKEIEELSAQIKGVKTLKDIRYGRTTAFDYLNDPDAKRKIDEILARFEKNKKDYGLDVMEQGFYDELKRFFDDMAVAQNPDIDVDSIRALIKTKRDELKVLETDLADMVNIKAKAMQKERIAAIDSQIDDLRKAMDAHDDAYRIKRYVQDSSYRDDVTITKNVVTHRIKVLERDNEFATDCITIGDRPDGISLTKYLDDATTRKFVDETYEELKDLKRKGKLTSFEEERLKNYEKFFKDKDDYFDSDDYRKLLEARQRLDKYNKLIDEGEAYAKKLAKLEKDKQAVTKEIEAFKRKYIVSGDTPRTASAKILDTLQEYAEKCDIRGRARLPTIASKLGLTEEDARDTVSAALAELIEGCDVGKRIELDAFEMLLNDPDKGLLQLFEVGTGSGCTDQGSRARAEALAFNYPRSIPTGSDVGDRPIYGMLIPNLEQSRTIDDIQYINGGPGTGYGDGITVVFKKNKIRNNASFTIGDSMDDNGIGSPFNAPRYNSCFWSFVDSVNDLVSSSLTPNEKLLTTFKRRYFEVQVHGKDNHGIDTIDKVYFTRISADRAKAKGLLDKLDALGIPYEILK